MGKTIEYILKDDKNKIWNMDTVEVMSPEKIEKIRHFHKSFAEYTPTPLVRLQALAKHLNVKSIYIKDESKRFNLNSFKVLGGAYAVGKYIAECLDIPLEDLSFEKLQSQELKTKLGEITFVTATDGNHGRGIAWAANALGQRCVVFMPKGTAEDRLKNIQKEGAKASIIDMNYDDAVRHALAYAKAHNGVLIQDSAWEGYEKIPTWIMQGYGTVMAEVYEEVESQDLMKPTHVFLQAGVGAFAGSMLGYAVALEKENYPKAIIVEPEKAACFYKSLEIGDGLPHVISGDMPTIMAGLACGEPCLVAWEILRDYGDAYLSCSDSLTALGMRILGNPLKGDSKVISGESGAIGMGVLYALQKDRRLADLKEGLQLDENSVILIISTEGDTYVDGYRKIVWEGAYPYSFE